METVENILFVRHLPSDLSVPDKEEFLRFFGAQKVRIMGSMGPMKHTAFAHFSDKDAATKALNRLHQLKLLGHRLVVEYARETDQKLFPSLLEDPKPKPKPEKQEKQQVPLQNLPSEDSVFKKWSIEYPRNPKLCYLYPPPTVSILTNIANALAACPKFYVQVLHLMNKMNLPAPFGAVTPNPPIPMQETPVLREPDNIETQEMEVSSTEESEIESEDDSQTTKTDEHHAPKRRLPKKPKLSRKKPRLLQNIQIPPYPAQPTVPVVEPSAVFENVKHPQQKKIEMRIPGAISHDIPEQIPNLESTENQQKETSEEDRPTEGGFGKIEPTVKVTTIIEMKDSDLPYVVDPQKFLSSEEIQKNRIHKNDWKNYSVFKRYAGGERTTRLYVKNVHKNINEQDLVNIYGNFINWESETEKDMFDIRLMTEGRMKGQCFITFPTEESAERALNSTNGYMFHDKPIVVQYARSAKAKETDDQKS